MADDRWPTLWQLENMSQRKLARLGRKDPARLEIDLQLAIEKTSENYGDQVRFVAELERGELSGDLPGERAAIGAVEHRYEHLVKAQARLHGMTPEQVREKLPLSRTDPSQVAQAPENLEARWDTASYGSHDVTPNELASWDAEEDPGIAAERGASDERRAAANAADPPATGKATLPAARPTGDPEAQTAESLRLLQPTQARPVEEAARQPAQWGAAAGAARADSPGLRRRR
jgi:hypothetical protein